MIDDKGVESLSSGLRQLYNLNSLELGLINNNIGDKGLKSLSQALSEQ